MQSSLLVYECEGEEKEIKEWFKTINIVGIPLKEQELLNAIYSGEFVNAAKRVFSNSQNAEIQKWSHYIKGDVKRQDYLAEALRWICDSKGMSIDAYMSIHRHEPSTGELESYFRSVIDWVSATFTMVERDIFEESTKRAAYKRQTEAAEKQGISNCPLCALGNNANKTRIYKLSEMDADHVTAWSKGGATSMENCEMLCKTHNRSKGNR